MLLDTARGYYSLKALPNDRHLCKQVGQPWTLKRPATFLIGLRLVLVGTMSLLCASSRRVLGNTDD